MSADGRALISCDHRSMLLARHGLPRRPRHRGRNQTLQAPRLWRDPTRAFFSVRTSRRWRVRRHDLLAGWRRVPHGRHTQQRLHRQQQRSGPHHQRARRGRSTARRIQHFASAGKLRRRPRHRVEHHSQGLGNGPYPLQDSFFARAIGDSRHRLHIEPVSCCSRGAGGSSLNGPLLPPKLVTRPSR